MAAARDLWRIYPFLTNVSLTVPDRSRLAPASGFTAASAQKVSREREGAGGHGGVTVIIVAPARSGKNRAGKCPRKQDRPGFPVRTGKHVGLARLKVSKHFRLFFFVKAKPSLASSSRKVECFDAQTH